MKKILTGLIVLLFIATAAIKAQSDKETKPPPPPPPPKIVDEKIKVPSPPPPPEKIVYKEIKTPPVITVTGKQADEFYERNPTISSISRKGNIITLKIKDGKEEKYDMSKDIENKSFMEKYGVSPIPPPPPSPPKIVDEKIKVPPPPPPAPPKPQKTT